MKKSAPYVENWVISRIKFADDKKVGVLEYHTLAFCASLRRNKGKDNDRNKDKDNDKNKNNDRINDKTCV